MALITCRDIRLAYENKTVLSGLSLRVEAGDYLCIVGENGSGKSTLIKALLGLKSPVAGDILTGDGLKQSEIGYLPQQSATQKDFPASVWEVVISGSLNHGGPQPFYSRQQKQLARRQMELLGIFDLKRRAYSELSGGQQKRVLLARALCATSKLLILDEPMAGLDPLAIQDLYRLIAKINDNGITIIMVSHDVKNAVRYAKHILHLEKRPLFYGNAGDYLLSEAAQLLLGGNDDV